MSSPTKSAEKSIDAKLIKALSHELRARALQLFNERGEMSPSEIADAIDIDVSLLSYHIRVLRECGCIEQVRTAPVRGAVEHFYIATSQAWLDLDAWSALPASIRASISGSLWGDIMPVVRDSLLANRYDSREERHLTWMRMTLDEQGWGEVWEALDEILPTILQAKERSAERLYESGDAGFPVAAIMTCFEMAAAEERA
jgi:DNA-binding transcriptional ArsR family regulator